MRERRLHIVSFIASLVLGCNKTPNVSVVVTAPASLSGEAAWVELGLFRSACPSSNLLSAGVPLADAVRFVRFPATAASPPLGDVGEGSYALLAAARDSSCAVVATGCSAVDLKRSDTVSVALSPLPAPGAACAADETCSDGQCLPNPEPASGWADAGCVLEVVAGGELPDPMVTGAVEQLSAPAVAAVDGGFIIAYREYDPSMGNTQLSVLRLDPQGGLVSTSTAALGASCAGAVETDGIGMTFDGSKGLIASARPPCAAAGIDFAEVSLSGQIEATAFASSTANTISLSDAHSLSGSPASTAYLAVLLDGSANLSTINSLVVSAATPFSGGGGTSTGAWVASSASGVALLEEGSDDGGATGGLEAAATPPSASLAGLKWAPLPGDNAGFAATDSTAFVLPFSTAAAPSSLFTFAIPSGSGLSSVALPALTGTPLSGSVFSADISAASEHLVLALAGAPHLPSIAGLRDGAVVVAVSNAGAVVVWTTTRIVGPSDNLGGYAVVGCVN